MAPRPLGSSEVPARELLLSGYPESVSDEALLAVLAGTAEGSAREILRSHPLPDLWRLCAEELVRYPGVGPAAAARVLACLEVSRRAASRGQGARPVVSTPEQVVEICGPQLWGLDREHFWILALNTKNRLLRLLEISVGSLNASIVHPRELFKEAVRVSAASVVLVHNHPSGDPTPSGADMQLTRRLVRAGDVLGIEVLDHVIIGDGGTHASLRDMGAM
ncbi:MAG: DNA repair protein RadC [Coriobacteriia bacterium]|nr:DNA repair protein RadC [Coriobacteriia bacterium]